MPLSNLDIDRYLADKPLAITLSGLEELRGHIAGRLALFDSLPRAFIEEAVATVNDRAQPSRGRPRSGAIGVIPIHGTISQHAGGSLSYLLFGGATTDEISASLKELLANDEVSHILLDIDSPGGTTFGIPELAAEIREARKQKPVVALANPVAASAAYWLGSQADQFYAIPSAIVGSIGVYGIHQDISEAAKQAGVRTTFISAGRYKTAGNQFEPLPDDIRDRVQSRIDEAYDMFVRDVAVGRGVAESIVRNGYAEGDIATAKQGLGWGMIDGINTFSQAVAKAATLRPAQAAQRVAAKALIEIEDTSDEEEETVEQKEARVSWSQWQGISLPQVKEGV